MPDKYEDEIRDILNRMNDFIPEGSQPKRPKPRQPTPWDGWLAQLRTRLQGYDSASYLIGMVLFALAAGLLRRIYPPLGALAALAAVACLLAAIVLPMLSRRYGRPEQRWRGRVIETQPTSIRRPFSWRYAWWRIKRFFGLR